MTQDYVIEPAFDDELNARLNAGIEPAIRREKTVGELIEEARQQERDAVRAKIQREIDRTAIAKKSVKTKDDGIAYGVNFGLRTAKALITELEQEGAENEQQSVQAGEAEEAEAIGSE